MTSWKHEDLVGKGYYGNTVEDDGESNNWGFWPWLIKPEATAKRR